MRNQKRFWFRRLHLMLQQGLSIFQKGSRQQTAWFVTGIYVFCLFYLMFGPLFRISSWRCEVSSGQACPDFVMPEMQKQKGTLIYLAQLDALSKKLHVNIPMAKQVVVDAVWPSTLLTKITWEEPMAQVGIPASSSAYLVADTGRIIGNVDVLLPDLPLIIASQAADLVVNQTLSDATIRATFEAIHYLDNSTHQVRQAVIESPYAISVTLQSGIEVLFTSTKPINHQVRALQVILSQTTIKSPIRVIDVRADRPVIKSTSQ